VVIRKFTRLHIIHLYCILLSRLTDVLIRKKCLLVAGSMPVAGAYEEDRHGIASGLSVGSGNN